MASNYDDNSDEEDDGDMKYFVVNHIYECEIAVTNVTARNKKTTLLY